MRYVIYGDDALGRPAREPFVIEADTEAEARGRAAARGIAVRAVIAESPPTETLVVRESSWADTTADKDAAAQLQGLRFVRLVLTPIIIGFFLLLAGVRTLIEAAAWTVVWSVGLLLGGAIAGVLLWGIDLPRATAWTVGLILGPAITSAMHGMQVGWRWWWAKRSLTPLAQAFGVRPDQAEAEEPAGLRVTATLAQALAGAVLGSVMALAGWAADWSLLVALAGILGGALGMGIEGAILGATLAWRRPTLAPGAATGPGLHSMAGLLGKLWGREHIARSWVVGYALDRAVPGAVAGVFVGLLAFALSWYALG